MSRRRVVFVAAAALAASAAVAVPAAACTARVLVLSAFPGEIQPLLAETSVTSTATVAGRTFYLGSLKEHPVALALTGIGLVNAAETTTVALEHFDCESGSSVTAIVLSGVSGGKTTIGDVTVPARWTIDDGQSWVAADAGMLDVVRAVAGDVALARAPPAGDLACVGVDPRPIRTVEVDDPPEILVGGDGSSADPFGGRRFPCWPGGGDVFGCRPCEAPSEEAPDLAGFAQGMIPFLDPAFFFGFFENPPALHGYDAEDMETAAVATVAASRGVPFVAFRALSDGAGDPLMLPGFPFQFFFYRQLAADNAAAVALEFLEQYPPS